MPESTLEVADQTVHLSSSERMDATPDGSVDFFITSPPYWDLKDYGHEGQIGRGSYEEYLERLDAVWAQCYAKARENAVLVINVNSRRREKRFYPIAFDIASRMTGWRLWDHVVWYVPNALTQPNYYVERLLDNKFESCLVFTRDGRTDYTFHKPRVPQKYAQADRREHKRNPRGRCLGNVIRVPAYRPPNVKEMGYHVAAFPEELVAFFVECYTDPGDVVLDPFLGSGTTLKVCRVMGRRGIGYEVNDAFADLIRRRIQEPWAVPDWRELDLLHAAGAPPGRRSPRKAQFRRPEDGGGAT